MESLCEKKKHNVLFLETFRQYKMHKFKYQNAIADTPDPNTPKNVNGCLKSNDGPDKTKSTNSEWMDDWMNEWILPKTNHLFFPS